LILAAPLKAMQGRAGGIEVKPFDLQSRLGKGRPVALLFWAPGFTLSETALVELSRYLHEREPRYELFAVAGKRDDQRAEMLWERFSMLDRSPGLPLLMDEGFTLSKQLEVTDVPDLVLIDAGGRVVVTKIKGMEQLISFSPERLTAQQVMARVALGTPTSPIAGVPPYYPASELFGRCAPEFTLADVTSGRSVPFTGRSPNGKPTLLMFWSSTCKHCQKEVPQLVAYVRDHPDALNVVSVSFIKPDRADGFSHRRVTQAYIQSHGIGWPVLDDSSGYANDLYRVVSTPTTFLLSPDGQVLDAWFYPHENLAQVIDQTLPRLAASRGQCRPAPPVAPAHAAFSVLDPDGKSVTLQSLTDRPSLVHLWATWCEPCRAELPGLLKFRRSLEESGGKVVLVSVEEAAAADRIRAYGAKFDPVFTSYRGPTGGLADLLDLGYSVPRTYVVGRGGQVLRTFYGAQSWDDPAFQAKIRALLQIAGDRG
jgi:thiol-disulfide isomerase/thioredoxin